MKASTLGYYCDRNIIATEIRKKIKIYCPNKSDTDKTCYSGHRKKAIKDMP